MTIDIPPELESSIQAAVECGHFASVDAAMTKAASMLVQQLEQDEARTRPAVDADAVAVDKPIWEEILELTADVPDEEWENLPTDLAEQHDHYIYGTPKRLPTRHAPTKVTV
jgi:Arc/MetJ-type ribon-helix-helix transcriptional regulator